MTPGKGDSLGALSARDRERIGLFGPFISPETPHWPAIGVSWYGVEHADWELEIHFPSANDPARYDSVLTSRQTGPIDDRLATFAAQHVVNEWLRTGHSGAGKATSELRALTAKMRLRVPIIGTITIDRVGVPAFVTEFESQRFVAVSTDDGMVLACGDDAFLGAPFLTLVLPVS